MAYCSVLLPTSINPSRTCLKLKNSYIKFRNNYLTYYVRETSLHNLKE